MVSVVIKLMGTRRRAMGLRFGRSLWRTQRTAWRLMLMARPFLNQRGQIRLQARAIFGRRLQEEIDQFALARSKMSADASSRQPMEQGHGLFFQQLLEFLRRHRKPRGPGRG
jgi:hypothetical protein